MVATYSSGSYTCSCKQGGGLNSAPEGGACIARTVVSSVASQYSSIQSSVTFRDMIDVSGNAASETVQSDTFSNNFIRAIGNCQTYGDLLACQLLANLCVLALYDDTAKVCIAYQALAKSRGSIQASPYNDQPLGLPWLYYGLVNRELPQTTQTHIPSLTLDVTGSTGFATIPFVLGVYALNGTFLGYQNLTTELQLCRKDADAMLGWNKATRYYTSSCSINLFNLVQSGYETYFYELFINQTAGGLYPVPVRITNYRAANGAQINANPSGTDWTGTQLMRRFFVLDTASGVLNGKAAVIRVPASIVFTIRKAPETGKIMLPIVDITYTERETSSIALQDQSVYSTPQISFSLAYEQDYAYMRQVLTILFSISLSAGVIYAFYIARLWNSRNLGPYDSIDIYFIMRLLLSIAGALGPIIGVFVFVLCMYFFVFYKLQSVMFVCLPHASTDTSMLSLAIAAVTVAEIAYIVRTLIRQCTTHIFFVDWERSKGRIVSSGNDPSAAQLAPVSVWRGIFMANQWNMLQTFQRVQIEFTLIVLLVLLEGLKLRNLAAPRPGFSDLSVDTPNPFLLLAVDCLCWLCLVVVQRAFHFLLFGRFYRNKLLQFIDLLSLANISLLIFDSPCHGYYIHGRSVHSYADTNMEELCNFLRKEENDMVPRRGLQDTNHQSFEVFVTLKMRSTFDKIFDQTTVQQPEVQRLNRMVNRLTVGEVRGGVLGDPIKPAADVQIQQYRQVNKFLRSFIDQNLKELPYAIREKTYFEQFVTSPDPSEGNVFFRSELGFAQTLLYGAESHMVLAYAYLFSYVDISCDSPALAAFVVWITHTALCFIRRHFGEINVSKKTLLDWKFLV